MPGQMDRKVIAVCGKGGVGKTAFTTMLCRILVESGRAGKLLIIDADPALGLPNTLGVTVTRTLGQVREAIIAAARDGDKKDKAEISNLVDYMVFEALEETDRFALLAMGHTDSLGCFCSVNDILRDAIDILSRKFDSIVIDGEAGLEQLNRQVMKKVGTLFILADSSHRGMQTVAYIKDMIDKGHVVQCDKVGVVFNRVSADHEDYLSQCATKLGVEIFGFIPQDELVAKYDLLGRPLMDLPPDTEALRQMRRIVGDHIFQ